MNARLAAYTAKLRELNFPFEEAYDDLVARLAAGEIGHDAPHVGDRLPSFILPSQTGVVVSLDDLTALGPVVVGFNRGRWCPFQNRAEDHLKPSSRNCGVRAHAVSIMPDRQEFTGDLRASTEDAIMILTDIDNGYALSLGLVLWVGEKLKVLMKGRGFHLDTFHGSDGWISQSRQLSS